MLSRQANVDHQRFRVWNTRSAVRYYWGTNHCPVLGHRGGDEWYPVKPRIMMMVSGIYFDIGRKMRNNHLQIYDTQEVGSSSFGKRALGIPLQSTGYWVPQVGKLGRTCNLAIIRTQLLDFVYQQISLSFLRWLIIYWLSIDYLIYHCI